MTDKENPEFPSLAAAEHGAGEYSNRSARDYTPPATGRPQVGDIVSVPGVGRCHVVGDSDPSLLTVQNAQGVEFRVGERAVDRLEGGAR